MKCLPLILLLGTLVSCAADPALRGPALLCDAQRQLHLASFDHVWLTVRDKHPDPSLGGLDWNAVRDELRPRVAQADTAEQARRAMIDMLNRLGESHFAIIPASSHDSAEPSPLRSRGHGWIGVDVRIVQHRAMVTRVCPGSPADLAGVRTGWIIDAIDRQPVDTLFDNGDTAHAHTRMARLHQAMMLQRMLSASPGESVEVRFLDEADQVVTLSILADQPRGTIARFGNLPPVNVVVSSRELPGNIGYLRLSSFFDPPTVMPAIESAIERFATRQGLILDLRGNTGGLGVMAMGIGGFLIDQPDQKLGTMITRDTRLHFVLNPRTPNYTGPVAVLVDELSASTSEILAQGLRDLGRARVFGTRTAGAALPSIVEVLPNGDRFQYALADYVSAAGHRLEGAGVEPDELVELDRATLLAGRDPVVEAAVAWIVARP
jgi:carboxyl-terminal processing protease